MRASFSSLALSLFSAASTSASQRRFCFSQYGSVLNQQPFHSTQLGSSLPAPKASFTSRHIFVGLVVHVRSIAKCVSMLRVHMLSAALRVAMLSITVSRSNAIMVSVDK